MRTHLRVARNQRGATFVEMMIAVAVLAIIYPVVVMLYARMTQAYAFDEIQNAFKKKSQEISAYLDLRLTSNRRLFQDNAEDRLFLDRVDHSGTCPVTMTGSRLPIIDVSGSVVPGSAGFTAANFGNSLFLLAYDQTAVLQVLDSSGNTSPVRMDLYRFYQYYLTPDVPPGKRIPGCPSYRLVEWKSLPYADEVQLQAISSQDPLRYQRTLVALAEYQDLVQSPRAGVTYVLPVSDQVRGVTLIVNPSERDPELAFSYPMTIGTPAHIHSRPLRIPEAGFKILSNVPTGILSGGFRYGVQCNSVQWSRAPRTVPQYATVNGNFPGGFEVGIVGPALGRKVFVRYVMAAVGALPRHVADLDVNFSANVRDLW